MDNSQPLKLESIIKTIHPEIIATRYLNCIELQSHIPDGDIKNSLLISYLGAVNYLLADEPAIGYFGRSSGLIYYVSSTNINNVTTNQVTYLNQLRELNFSDDDYIQLIMGVLHEKEFNCAYVIPLMDCLIRNNLCGKEVNISALKYN